MKKLTLSLALTLLSAIVLTATAKTIYFNGGWSATPYAYVYYEPAGGSATEYVGKWPGTVMQADGQNAGWYSVAIPDDVPDGTLVIFNTNTGSERYPADSEPGIGMPWLSTGQDAAYYVLADEQWYDAIPAEKPVVTANPSGGRFAGSVTVTLSCSMDVEIHYTTDGSEPSASSRVYSQPLTFTETTTLKTFVENEGSSNVQTFKYTYSEGGSSQTYPSFNNTYYQTNPGGKVGTNRTINMVHTNGISSSALSEWTDAELIAQGIANDIQQRFNGGHEWSLCDVYSLYAAYDADYLYLGCQYVNTSGLDKEHSTPYSSMLPICVALDLDPDLDCTGAMADGQDAEGPWQKNKQFLNFENGMDCMVMFHTQTAQGTPGVFLPDADGKFSYDGQYCKTVDARAYQQGLLPSITEIWGKTSNDGSEAFYADAQYDGTYSNVGKIDDPNAFLQDESNFGDFLPSWGSEYHTFYEVKISLATLGISEDYIKNTGIGVMWISTHGESATSSIPYDPTCFDNVMNPYSEDSSTSEEKEDEDYFTYAMARVGKLAGTPSAIDETVDNEGGAVVSVANKVITVSGNEGNDVAVYDMVGNCVAAANQVEESVSFNVPSKGTYVVVAGDKAVKVMVL